MIPSSTKSCSAVVAFPDVCKTPIPGGPVPTPYPNIAHGASNASTATKITPAGLPTLKKASTFSNSMGDEVGAAKGLVSSKVMGAQSLKMVSMQAFNVGGVHQTAAGTAHLLRNRLNHLNQQLTSLSGRNPELWHSLVDEYVQVTANLYVTLAESNQH